ncbi:hypothetical protein IE81DRAFT_344922 [Ceraceosorus guamensis]|uniref:MIP18 family-like domain-containing protein n=1 Tax=Ceraceosorus guamensis TaxID=1522189 RepID=A0A316W5T7_9BASI|nr:hypothetical protein IE81DRAFT_344922 [Ceraceosorus guamensis]PWN45229.1 hypothetical protein IE81DRAFT_344922 [Ceraceosorus guamensis]
MADKENANPIIHAPSGSTQRRKEGKKDGDLLGSLSLGGGNDWWRDPAVHDTSSGGLGRGFADASHGLEDGLEESDASGGAALAEERQGIDALEVFDLIRSVSDPEHPLTLEQLAVVQAQHIKVDEGDPQTGRLPTVLLEFTPTIPHCSMATLIGLALRVRLLRALPPRYKVDIQVRPGTHQSERAINKQLNDKERVAAALENNSLLSVVGDCLSTARRRGLDEAEALREAEKRARELGLDIAVC